jgi:RNA polymerase sigma-70 factor (ECF subfamily)
MAWSNSFLPYLRSGRESLSAAPELESVLGGLIEAGKTTWPDLALAPEVFLRHVAEHLIEDGDLLQILRMLHAGDLYLACCCSAGDKQALQHFERHFLTPAAEHVSRSYTLPADDVKQALRARLLVGRDGLPPKIAGYSGQGPLGAWLRMTATRVAIDLRQAESMHHRRNDQAAPVLFTAPPPDPEIAYLRARYAGELETAFHSTMVGLSTRERNVLRLHFLESMSAEAIGKVYGVSTRTANRWLERTRQRILAETRRLLAERLDLSSAQIDGVIRLFQGHFNMSVFTVLQGPDA